MWTPAATVEQGPRMPLLETRTDQPYALGGSSHISHKETVFILNTL